LDGRAAGTNEPGQPALMNPSAGPLLERQPPQKLVLKKLNLNQCLRIGPSHAHSHPGPLLDRYNPLLLSTTSDPA